MVSRPAPVAMMSWSATPGAPDVIQSTPPRVSMTSISVSLG